MTASPRLAFLLTALLLAVCGATTTVRANPADDKNPGTPVLPDNALTTSPVGGLEQTQATTSIVPVTQQPFRNALRVVIRKKTTETNATQLTIPISVPVTKGDTLLATVYLRGTTTSGKEPGQIALLFEKTVDPWTKSMSQGVIAPKNPQAWKRVVIPFSASESYQPGEAMFSLRFAFGQQTVEVGGLSVINYGTSVSKERLVTLAAERNPLGNARVIVDRTQRKQTLIGFGGNFCQPRYGRTEPMDPVGAYNLEHLSIAQARVGIPLNVWCPEPGVFRDTAQAHAALQQMQLLSRRKIPIIGTVWEGPQWMLGGNPEQMQRTLPPAKYKDCIEAIAQFLVTARDKYGVSVPYFSFNEADYGVNFRFTSEQIATFIAQAGPRFRALGLKTRFLAGDTSSGAPTVEYARPLLANRALAPYLGPLAFHCWDVLDVSDSQYREIAALGKQYNKEIWCTEAGHDSQLWQKTDPWGTWDNALRTALAYEKTLRLTGASIMDYWTYQDNYPIISADGKNPYPVFRIIRQMQDVLPKGSTVVSAVPDNDGLQSLSAVGPKPGQFSLLLINTLGGGNVTVSGLPAGKMVTITRSTEQVQLQSLRIATRVDAKGNLAVVLPSRSVVTVQAK